MFLGRPSRSLVITLTTLFGHLKIHTATGILLWSIRNEHVPLALVSLNCVCATGHKAFSLGNRDVFQECNEGLQGTPPISGNLCFFGSVRKFTYFVSSANLLVIFCGS
jgi:hypothetical protein